MIEKTQAQIIGALVQMCEAYHTLSGSPYIPGTSDDCPQQKLLKAAILSLKAKVQDLADAPPNLRLAMIQTCDRDICLGLQIGPSAPRVSIPLERQEILAKQDPQRFIFMAERGLAPKAEDTDTELKPVFVEIFHLCAAEGSEEFASALACWCHGRIQYQMLLSVAACPGNISTPKQAALLGRLVRSSVFLCEETHGGIMLGPVGTVGPFAATAIALTKAKMSWSGPPSAPIKEVVDAAQSPHLRLALLKTYGSLERFLLEWDRKSYFRLSLSGHAGQDEEKNYRIITSVKWGPHYNPEDDAHHMRASNAEEAARRLATSTHFLQMHTKDGWQNIYDIPYEDGGLLNPPAKA